MRGKKYLWTLFILMFLGSMANISIPTTSSPIVTFRVDPPQTTGVSPGSLVLVNVSIEADPGTAVVGWRISIKVDPDVLEPGYTYGSYYFVAWTGKGGYFLYDWCVANNWDPDPGEDPTIGPHNSEEMIGIVNQTAGTITNTTESIKKWTDLGVGVGADGNGTLVMFYFTSKSADAWSAIQITEAYYFTSWKGGVLDRRVPDFIINGHYNEPDEGEITGKVTDETTGTKITGATVEAVGFETKSDTTTGDGTYAITDLVPGVYMVTASKGGCEDVTHEVTVEANETATCDFVLPTAIMISVEVARRKAWAKPIDGQDVTLNAIIKNYGTVATNATVIFTFTDSAGMPVPPYEGVTAEVQRLQPGEALRMLECASWTAPEEGPVYYGKAQAWYDTDDDGVPDTLGAKVKKFRINV